MGARPPRSAPLRQSVCRAQVAFAGGIREQLVGAAPVGGRAGAQSGLQELSDRELEVFNLLGRGLGTRQIAQTLNVSITTVQA